MVIMRDLGSALPDDRPITSLCIVEDVARCPPNYTVISQSYDQDVDADLCREGFFKRVTRYLCYSKTEGYLGYVVEQLLVVHDKDACPPGFTNLSQTMDSNQKSFKKKQICFKALSRNSAKQIITDIVVLSNTKIAPEGFTMVGDMNGMCVCYKSSPTTNSANASPTVAAVGRLPYQVGPVGSRSGSQSNLYPALDRPSRPAPPPPHYVSPLHRPNIVPSSPITAPQVSGDGDTYEAVQSGAGATKPLPDLTSKSASLIESEYYYCFSLEQDIVQRSMTS